MRIPLSRPDITDKEIDYVIQVLKTPNLSMGPKVSEFEEKIAQYLGSNYAIAVNSGTSGLHLCIKALGISDGDEVITSAFSFVASANCLLYEKAIPAFVDIDKNTMNIDLEKIEEYIEKTRAKDRAIRIKAILPIHVFGQPCEMDRIIDIANRYNLPVIEDACEALGAEYEFDTNVRYDSKNNHKSVVESSDVFPSYSETTRWKKVGTIGKAGVFAFYPNKQMTTGEGGIIVTDDEDLACMLRSLRNQGRNENGKWLSHVRLGYNYRLSDINCALGIAQLERIEEILQKRTKVANMYNERLKDIEGIEIPFISSKVKMSWFVYVVRLDERFSKEDRDIFLTSLQEKGIECNNYFPPIHLQPLYVEKFGYRKGFLPITESISERTIALPFYNNLKEQDVEFVCSSLKYELANRCSNNKF
jgi:perosamine synthetase